MGSLRGVCGRAEGQGGERCCWQVGVRGGDPPWGSPETGGVEATGRFLYVVVMTTAGGHRETRTREVGPETGSAEARPCLKVYSRPRKEVLASARHLQGAQGLEGGSGCGGPR